MSGMKRPGETNTSRKVYEKASINNDSMNHPGPSIPVEGIPSLKHVIPVDPQGIGQRTAWGLDALHLRRAVDSQSHPSKHQGISCPTNTRPSDQHRSKHIRSHSQPQLAHHNTPPVSTHPSTPVSAQSQSVGPWQQSPSPTQPYRPSSGPYGRPIQSPTSSSRFSSPALSHVSHQSQGYFSPPSLAYIKPEQRSVSRGSIETSGLYHQENVPFVAPAAEPWVQESQTLERQKPHEHNGDEAAWQPAYSVARPLPSTFSAQEEVLILPSSIALRQGMSVSKYFLGEGYQGVEYDIRDTREWQNMKDDPIFSDISTDGECVSVEELIARRDKVLQNHIINARSSVERDYRIETDNYPHHQFSENSSFIPRDMDLNLKGVALTQYALPVNHDVPSSQQDLKDDLGSLEIPVHTYFPRQYKESQRKVSSQPHQRDEEISSQRRTKYSRPSLSRADRKRAFPRDYTDDETSHSKLPKRRRPQFQPPPAYRYLLPLRVLNSC